MILPPAIQDVEQLLAQQWDFVVIGGGTAGLALASLLSDNASVRVLVLERGVHRPNDPIIQAPVLWTGQLGNPEYDGGYMSVPQGATGKPVWFSAAKTLGGTSTLNAMSFIPPPRNELQAWVELGNSEESAVGLLDELKAVENFKASTNQAVAVHEATGKPELRGTNGALPGRHSTLTPTILPQWYETLRALGIRTGVDPRESGVNIGGFMVQNAITDENERAHAANSYYTPRSNRENLAVITEAQVNRVVLSAPDSDSGPITATGVEFTYQDRVWTVLASKEIVLSGGTFGSPKILELSGIGNKHILEAAGVEVKLALNGVGENLHDHWAFGFSFRFDPSVDIVTLDQLRDPSVMKTQTEQYTTSRTGLLAAGQPSVMYISASQLFNEEELASILAGLDEDVEAAPAGLREQYAVTRRWLTDPEIPFIEVFPQYQYLGGLAEAPGPHEKFFTMYSFVTHPCSRGSVHITNADPAAPPMLDPRFWSHPFDKQISRAAYRFGTERLAKTEPLASLLAGPGFPAADAPEAVIDEMLSSGFSGHGIGTCSMLPREKGGVVDDNLQVHGTKNLRIVDASVFPLHISGHPQALVYALAHRAARLIADEHGLVVAA